MRISDTILDIITALRTAIELDDTSHTTSMTRELSRLPEFEGSTATAGYHVSPEGDIKDDHWWLIMDDGSVFDADADEPTRCSKKDSRHGRYFPYTGETGIPAAVLQAADHLRSSSRVAKNKSFSDMVGEGSITETHDYNPEWDYEVDEQGHDEDEIMQYVNKAIEDVKREVLPVLGFQDMKVFFTPEGGLDGDVGKYIYGTSSYPVVGLDLRHTMDGVNFNEHAFFQQIRASLAHELAHAYQESRYGEDALYHDDLEDDAEAFAYNWVMNGKLDPSVLEMKFDEASGASAPSAAARQAPEALPDAMTMDGQEGMVVDEFDDESKPEDLQAGWEDLVGEDEGDLKEVDHPEYMPGGENGTDNYDPTYDERSVHTNAGWPRP